MIFKMKKRLLFGIIIINSALFFGQSVSKTIQLLPDTGQTTSYTSTFGEDHDYLINTPSYTNNGDGTITDNVTGLMWQQADGGEMTHETAITYCDNLILGGHSDWRLPTPIEAFSILIHENGNPAINTNYFTPTGAEYWWTSVFEKNLTTKVWVTNAGGGIGNHLKTETISAGGTKKIHARAVRNSTTPTTLTNHFTDNNDGTITDNLTQLIWQKVPNTSTVTWENALSYAEGLSLANATDWRLPNIKELQSLNNELATNPSVFSPYFGSLGTKKYWSSTSLRPNGSNPNSAWYWYTQYGITAYDVKTNSNSVICVRGNSTLAVNQDTHRSSIKIYPNPASNYILIFFTTDYGHAKIELVDSLGKVIVNKQIKKNTSEYRIETDGIPDGIYYLSVSNDNNKDRFKIIINKKC
jgi:hypothetical protein